MSLKWRIRRTPSPGRSSSDESAAGSPPTRSSLTSRIAKALSRSTEVRIAVEQPGRLFKLPYELVGQILDKIDSKTDLCSLRRTCILFNDVLEPRIFGDLLIDSVAKGSHKTGSLLKTLASGKALFAPVVSALRISNVLIFSGAPSQNAWQDPNVQPLQARYIAPAFKQLRNLKRVYWNLKIKDPYSVIADALAALPSLEELHITIDHWVPTSVFPFDKFSRLTVLAVQGGDYQQGVAYPTAAALKKAIQASPHLTDLRIGTQIEFRPSLDDILPEIPPRITRLHALDSYWRTLKMFPTSLTHVALPNVSEGATCAVWEAFTKLGVHLRSVTVDDITPSLVRYFLSYTGLETLRFEKTGTRLDEHPWHQLIAQLYMKVLPQHRGTLRTFWVEAAFRWSDVSDPFTLLPEYLEAVMGCRELREVSVPLYYHASTLRSDPEIVPPSIGLSDLLYASTQLPRLQLLHIALACAVSIGGMPLIRSNKLALLDELQALAFSQLDTIPFAVQFFDDCFVLGEKGCSSSSGDDGLSSRRYCLRPQDDNRQRNCSSSWR